MQDDERLREALLELKILREREAQSLKETSALLSGLESLASASTPQKAISSLIEAVHNAIDSDLVVLFMRDGDDYIIRDASDPSLQDVIWSGIDLGKRARRIVDATTVPEFSSAMPNAMGGMRSFMIEPARVGDQTSAALVCCSAQKGKFSRQDADLLARYAQMAAQVLQNQSLHERNAFLAAVIEESSTAVSIAETRDPEMPLIYVNRAFEELTGYDRSEVLGMNCRFLNAEEPDSYLRQRLRETVENREIGTYILRNKRKDGSIFWNELRLFPIKDDTGFPVQIVATQLDATARIEAEVQRDEARRRLESALSSTEDGFLLVGETGQIAYVNTPFSDAFAGVDWDLDQPFQDTMQRYADQSLRDQDMLKRFAATALDTAQSFDLQLLNGRSFLINSTPVSTGGAVITASEITRLKIVERTLRQRVAAIENAADGMAVADKAGRIIYANPSLAALWELDNEDQAIGRKWSAFYDRQTHPSLHANADAAIEKYGSWSDQISRENSDEQISMHDLSLRQIPDIGLIINAKDITKRLADEAERNRLSQRIEQASLQEEMGQIAAGLAHDFNNLLSAVLGSASLIESDEDASAPIKEAASRISTAGQRAASLVDQLLDLGKRHKHVKEYDLRKLIDEAINLKKANLRSGVALSAVLGDAPILVHVAQTDIVQIVLNLVINAEAAIDGQGEINVTLEQIDGIAPDQTVVIGQIDPKLTYVKITIQDTGSGIPKDQIDKIFEPYFTTKGDDGTGLGLPVVCNIIEENNGAMSLRSAINIGTTFTIFWPLSAPAQPASAQPPASKVLAQLTGRTILVVDDEPEILGLMERNLARSGAEIATTEEPQFALEAVQEDPLAWDCVVTDFNMPGMNGDELIAQIRLVNPKLPIIVVSALAKRLKARKFGEGVVSAILAKPVDYPQLEQEIKQAIGAHDAVKAKSED